MLANDGKDLTLFSISIFFAKLTVHYLERNYHEIDCFPFIGCEDCGDHFEIYYHIFGKSSTSFAIVRDKIQDEMISFYQDKEISRGIENLIHKSLTNLQKKKDK